MLVLLLVTRVIIGDAFPPRQLADGDGAAVDVVAPGKIVVVDFFATWCEPCRDELPILEGLRARFGDRVTFVTVSEDTGADARDRVARFAAEMRLGAPILFDADHALYERLGVRKLPTTYVVDATGTVRHINNGFGPGYRARVARWIAETLRAEDRRRAPH
ncbi:MAG TPA: TlpA disulfide reductase family protein [Haliangiales bacterium]|nr:TlpA disulfide reductase family protein [Haliangiales bacterium]